jgi:hypothetical protein
MESLEPRHLLSADLLSLPEVRGLLAAHEITGATVVTHGFQPSNNQTLSSLGNGDSLRPLALAIANRADAANGGAGTAWLLDYDIPGEGVGGVFDMSQSVLPDAGSAAQQGELVLLFDWAPESNELSAGWGEAAGDALFNIMVGLGVVNPALGAANDIPLHFIAHSFGSAVTSEAIERLARFDVPVDQVTYLDPHDFDQSLLAVDGDQRLFDLGRPDGYGAAVWKNVAFADVYYQTRGLNSLVLPDTLVPDGRPIPGAYNVLLDGELPTATMIGPYDLVGRRRGPRLGLERLLSGHRHRFLQRGPQRQRHA